MGVASVTVEARDLDPGHIVLTAAAAAAAGGGVPLAVGDRVSTSRGERVVVAVEPGAAARAFAVDGDGRPWPIAVGARAMERLLAPAPSPLHDAAYHPVHHTPMAGVPVSDAHLDWLESQGVWHVREEIAWRQEHRILAQAAFERRAAGQRPRPAWLADPEDIGVGMGPIREGLRAQARVLGFELRVGVDGVRLGLLRRQDPASWSAGAPTTSAAFRHGSPVAGGVHDPALVGPASQPVWAHIVLPFAILPRHLEPWVAGLVDREIPEVRGWARAEGVEGLREALDEALQLRVPRPTDLDGTPLCADDFLWSWVPVLPAAYRQGRSEGERRFPHGIDGTLHALVAEVRKVEKLGGLDAVPEALRPTLRARVCDAVDQHLGWSPDDLADDHRTEGWGWSIALDLRETLSIDGVMLDLGGQAVAVVERDRERVGLPARLCSMLLHADEPEEVVLLTLPDGITVVRPERVEGPVIWLPVAEAEALGVRSGDTVWMLPMIGAAAQAELRAIVEGLRLAAPPRFTGWLDDVAAVAPESLLLQLAHLARTAAVDACAGPVGRRVFGGVVAPPVGTPGDEVRLVQRAMHALKRVLAEHEPGTRLRRGASAGRLRDLPELRAEVGALFTAYDGQHEGGEPLWVAAGQRYHFSRLGTGELDGAAVIGEAGSRRLVVRSDGRVVAGDEVVAGSLALLVHSSLLARLEERS